MILSWWFCFPPPHLHCKTLGRWNPFITSSKKLMGFVTISLRGLSDGTSGIATHKKIIRSLFSADQFICSSFHLDLAEDNKYLTFGCWTRPLSDFFFLFCSASVNGILRINSTWAHTTDHHHHCTDYSSTLNGELLRELSMPLQCIGMKHMLVFLSSYIASIVARSLHPRCSITPWANDWSRSIWLSCNLKLSKWSCDSSNSPRDRLEDKRQLKQ